MIGQDLLDQFLRLLRPVQTRIANSIARAVVQNVSDQTTLQELQIGVLSGEDIDNAERFQEYGFSSVPLAGAEAVAVFPNGERGHPLVVAIDDRRHRPTGGAPGEVRMYHHAGAVVTMLDGGAVEIRPAPGGEVFVRSDGGATEPLVKKSEFDAHLHPAALGPTEKATIPAVGTTVLKAE